MTNYKITCNGINYGLYEASSEDAALDKMFADAGYSSREESPNHIDPDAFTVQPMELRNGGARGTVLVPAD